MSKKNPVEPSISVKVTAVVQLLFAVAAQVPNATAQVVLATITLAGLIMGASGRLWRSSGRS